ncbi:MAG: DUF72 domain-containing protein [Nanoarchaeota archaeon]
MTKYIIGTSGWNYEHWKKRFYPENLAKSKWLDFYVNHFDTVEVNYSFYRWPNEKVLLKWHKHAPKNFLFTLKAPRLITHIKKINNVELLIKDFNHLTSLLKNNLGCYLFQLPPSLKFNEKNFDLLNNFLKILNNKIDNVIEFRHKSWWNDKVYHLLKKNKIGFCIVSGLDMPDSIVLSADFAYFRFHGNSYSSNYSKEQLKKYAGLMKTLKCKRVYAYFNNDANAYSVYNALELKRYLA